MACRRRIRVENLTVTYKGSASPAIEDVTLEVKRGELVALTGPNGGGKTTLLNTITGLIPHLKPARVEGEICVDGSDPRREPVFEKVQLLRQDAKVQVVGPTALLEAAANPLFRGLPGERALELALEALDRVGARHLVGRATHRLSGGELQRVALAGSLSLAPSFLALDEPTSHLDDIGAELVVETLSSLRDEGVGLLVATHDRRIIGIADKVYTVNKRLFEGSYTPNCGWPTPCGEPNRTTVIVENVTASYEGAQRPSIEGVSLSARDSSITAIVGPNGSGKTTILYALAGILKPQRGSITIRGRPLLVPYDPLLSISKTTLREELGEKIPEWAEEFGDKPVLTLSWGQLRLVSIALAEASDREIILIDEPTSGLDPCNRVLVARLLCRLAESGKTIVVATHDARLAGIARTVYTLRGGRVESCLGDC
jgi:energy-coupling factor transporter ATP-binding protein EcfA2